MQPLTEEQQFVLNRLAARLDAIHPPARDPQTLAYQLGALEACSQRVLEAFGRNIRDD